MKLRRRLPWLLGIVLAASGAVNAQAFWVSTDSSNHAAAVADALQQGSTPTATKTGATSVDVAFTRANTLQGREITGYLILRYDSPVATSPVASFSCDWPSATTLSCSESSLPDGTWYYTNTTRITGSLWEGTESTMSNGVTVDTTAPDPPSTPDLADASDSGTSNTDNVTNNSTPVFTGTAEAGSTVKIFAGVVQVGSGTATGGSYSIEVSTLGEGAHTITATATDALDNVSAASSGLVVTIDATAPAAPATPDLAAGSDTGTSATDNLTNDTTPTFTGTAETGVLVTILDGGSPVGSGTATGGNYSVTTSTLSEGAHTITAVSSDPAGNVSSASSGLVVTIDTTAPAIPSAPDLAAGSDSGTSDTDNLTNDTTPTFTGTADAGSTVNIYAGVSLVGSGTATGGNYSITASTLSQGAHSVTATATDAAGNASAASTGLNVTIDTSASAPSTPDLDAGSDTGSSATDNITSDTTPTFTGTAEAGSTVTVYSAGVEVGSGTATGGNYTITTSALAEGARSITARVTDAAGNLSSATSALVVTVDTTAPVVLNSVISKEIGFLSGSIKNSGKYFVYANIVETGGGVAAETANVSAISSGGAALTLTAGSYSTEGIPYNYRSVLQTALASPGTTYSILSTTDVAGNTQSQSNHTVIVDNTAPTATDIQTANFGSTVGRAEAGDTITFTFSERIDPESILSGWNGTSTNVTVRVIDGGGCVLFLLCADDTFEIFNSANTSALPLGPVDLKRVDYNGNAVLGLGDSVPLVFGASSTRSTMVQVDSVNIRITLGTLNSGSPNTAGGNGTMTWDPPTTPYDAAGNALTGTAINESGSGDREF
ncbi:MAG: Ig-like domain-containing protein [Actinomycetota bacterium]